MIKVIEAGFYTTIQDQGRFGFRHLGVPISGPMDGKAFKLANALLPLKDEQMVLECTLTGPTLEINVPLRFVVTGATVPIDLDGQYVGDTIAIVVALNVITMGLGYGLAKAFGLNLKQGLTIAIESGIQNGTLTISLAVITLNQPDFAIVAAIYSLVMYALSSVPIYFGLNASK